jgi:GxxExxY protein
MDDLTKNVIGCAYRVHNELGCGFLEKVYENALLYELRQRQIDVISQKPLSVKYKGIIVGEYFADLFIQNSLICEIKAVNMVTTAHEVQLVNYLNATKVETGLLINFGASVEIKRKYRIYNKQSCKSC